MTKLEIAMHARGYASTRICSAKLGKNYRTILSYIKKGQLRAQKVGFQQFVEIESIREFYGSRGDLLRLDDWSDVLPIEEGVRHVRQVSV